MREKTDPSVINAQRNARIANRCFLQTSADPSLGEHAVRLAQLAAALHMTQAAGLLPLFENHAAPPNGKPAEVTP